MTRLRALLRRLAGRWRPREARYDPEFRNDMTLKTVREIEASLLGEPPSIGTFDPRLWPEPAPHRFCQPPPDFRLMDYEDSFFGVRAPVTPEKAQRLRVMDTRRWEAENGISMHEAENRFQAWGCWHRDAAA